MRLISLEGENFRQFHQLGPIYFPKKGRIGLSGPNGTGKTTILDAIELALFGSITGGGSGKVKASEIKHQEAAKSSKWWVELVFEKDGVQYKVQRHESTAKAALYANGVELQVGQRDVTEHITNKVLKMDQTAYLNAFYAKQGQIENLNELKNEDRKREVSKLLKIDKIDKAIKLLREDKNILNTQIEEQGRYLISETIFNEELTQLKETKKNLKEVLKNSEETFKKLEVEYQTHNVSIAKLEETNNTYLKLNNTFSELQNEQRFLENDIIAPLSNRIVALKEEAKKIPQLKGKLTGLKTVEERIKLFEGQRQLFERKNYLMNQLESSKLDLTNQKKTLDELKKNVLKDDYDKQIQDKTIELNSVLKSTQDENDKLMKLNSELHLVTEDGKRKRTELNNIVTLGSDSTCPVCKRGLGEHHNHLVSSFEEEISKLVNDYSSKKATIDSQLAVINELKGKELSLTSEINSIKNLNENNKLNKVRLDTAMDNFKRTKDDYVRIESEIKSLGDIVFDEVAFKELKTMYESLVNTKYQLESIQDKVKELTTFENEFKTRTDRLNVVKKETGSITAQLKALNFNQDIYNKEKEKTNQLFEALRQAEKNVMENKQSLELNEAQIKETTKKKKENQKINVALNDRKEKFGVLLYLDEIYKNYKVDMLAKVSPSIAAIMEDLLTYLTDGKYDKVKLDPNYNIFIYRNGEPKPMHMFSGGERALIALTQRLAISQLIVAQSGGQEFDFLSLDEVFGSLDQQKQLSVLDSLSKLNDVFPQILMISHNEDLNNMFDYVLHFEQNPDLSSKTRWAEKWDEEEIANTIL